MLELKNINKSISGIRVLNGENFRLEKGFRLFRKNYSPKKSKLKSDKKIRHGEYNYKNSFSGKLLVHGYYKFGSKDSIWDCFDRNGELISKYDYTKNELVFYNPKSKKIEQEV